MLAVCEYFSPTGQGYHFLKVSVIFLSWPAGSAHWARISISKGVYDFSVLTCCLSLGSAHWARISISQGVCDFSVLTCCLSLGSAHWARISISKGVCDFSVLICYLSLGSDNMSIIHWYSKIMLISTIPLVTWHANFSKCHCRLYGGQWYVGITHSNQIFKFILFE